MAPYASSGHVVYTAPDGSLMGVPFDLGSLELTGTPVALLQGVAVSTNSRSQFALSETGTLVFVSGGQAADLVPVWVERDGTARQIDPNFEVLGNATWSSFSLSPDGERLALSMMDAEGRWDLWVKQLDAGPLSRLTFEGPVNRRPSWSPDGQVLQFLSSRNGAYDLWSRRADGSGTDVLELDPDISLNEAVYSPDGTWLVVRDTGDDIFGLRPGVDSVPAPLIATEFSERYIAVSPDGRWLAYVSDRSAREEVYVVPFPDVTSDLVQVSVDGGTEPVWAHSGRTLFYRSGANELVEAQVTGDPTFTVGEQNVLFSMARYLTANGYRQFVVSPDDQRFVMLELSETVDTEILVVENFFEELKARVGN